ncbi:integrator complex subunit 15 isoform X2 [Hypanus sabinus]|uniref:integrator complex subunit 15 isoform X2 n=1 Tax=Hypanus sabinus TaxID=79690 RepID=UPI0028C4376A|nr:integrator complex subunit 15 isoform X2 [Hypanus sabinus]
MTPANNASTLLPTTFCPRFQMTLYFFHLLLVLSLFCSKVVFGHKHFCLRVEIITKMTDIRHSLLRRDALSAAKELLYHLDIFFNSQLQNVPGPLVDKSTIELVEEFIFQLPKERNTQPKGNKADENRLAMLGKLVSMAIAICRVPILECTALWLQRTHAVFCVKLAKVLVEDYCILVPGSVQTLKRIVHASPRFCCQLITAVTALYDLSTDDLIPPQDLLEMVVSWVYEDPRLTLITFLNSAANLPRGFLELTPLPGLIRWCVLAPLAYKKNCNASSAQSLVNGHTNKVCKEVESDGNKDFKILYSKLHLSVLQVLMILQGHLTEKNLYGRLELIMFDHVERLVGDINKLVKELNPSNPVKEVELTLDRLAQALQVGIASGALLCARDDLRSICSALPHNNLLQLVLTGPVQQSSHTALPPGFYPHIHASPARYPMYSTHPVQTYMPGMAFSYRPIR